jgi:hypothetical protein
MIQGGWKYAASSVVGTSHQSKPDGVCQDFHTCRYVDGPYPALVAIVSDGAGSASHSECGSRCTCEYVDSRLAQAAPGMLFTRDFALHVLGGLRQRLGDLAANAGLTIRDFACTLLVAIVSESRAAFWQIGDGAMCFRLRETETFQYAFWPEKGDYANVTFFVTDTNAEQHLEFDVTDGEIIELAAFSDGLERLALDFAAGEVHSGFFNGLFPYLRTLEPGYSARFASQLADFLASERINKRTDDDKTLILASRAV